MSALILLALLLAGAAGLACLLRCRIEQALPLFVFGLITAAYLCALLGLLPVAPWLLWCAAGCGGVVTLWHLVKRRCALLGDILPGAAAFVLAGLLLWWLCRGCDLVDWDDFSHWGKSLKIMFYSGELYTAPESTDGFKSYPPATVLLQYTLMRAVGSAFREDMALYANALLTGAVACWPLQFVLRQKPQRTRLLSGVAAQLPRWLAAVVAVPVLVLLPVAIYPRYYYILGVDGLLGVLCALILAAGLRPGADLACRLTAALGCGVLTLVKSSGAGLAALAGVVLLAACLWERRDTLKNGPAAAAKTLVLAAAPLLVTLAAKLSWSAHLQAVQAVDRWQSSDPVLPALWNLLRGAGPAWRYQVLAGFGQSVLGDANYGGLLRFSYVGWLAVVFLLLGLALWVAPAQCRSRIALWGGSAVGIALVFTLSLLYTYLFLFDQGEALALASISRYLSTCLQMLLLTAALCLFAAATLRDTALSADQTQKRGSAFYPLAAVAALCVCLPFVVDVGDTVGLLVNAPTYSAQTGHDRYLARRAAQRVNALGEQSPRLYLITANDAGITQLQVEYELLPTVLPPHQTILMNDPPEDEPWVKQCTWQQWQQLLAEDGYEYVYIYCPEDQFVREFLPIFEDESQVVVDRMFRVITDENGTLLLRNMPEITATQPLEQ